MENELKATPSMATVLANVETSLSDNPDVTKFAPPKFRQGVLAMGEVENIQASIRKKASELLEDVHRLALWCDQAKVALENLQRSCG